MQVNVPFGMFSGQWLEVQPCRTHHSEWERPGEKKKIMYGLKSIYSTLLSRPYTDIGLGYNISSSSRSNIHQDQYSEQQVLMLLYKCRSLLSNVMLWLGYKLSRNKFSHWWVGEGRLCSIHKRTWTFLIELGEMSRPGEGIGRVRALLMTSVTARSQADSPLRFLWVKHREMWLIDCSCM